VTYIFPEVASSRNNLKWSVKVISIGNSWQITPFPNSAQQ